MQACRFAFVLASVLLAAPIAAQTPRLCGETLLTFDATRSLLHLIPTGGAGIRGSLSFVRAPEPFEAMMLRDYVLRRDGRLAVSAAGILTGQGGTANLILEFDARDFNRPAALRNTGPVVCSHIEDDGNALWCLGSNMSALLRGQDYGVLYRLGDESETLEAVLKRSELPRESTQSPWAGGAQLLAIPGGGVVAWMPGVNRMARVDGGGVRVTDLPWEHRPHSIVSVALDPHGRLHALLPLADEEKLDTRYGLFRGQGSKWTRVAPNSSVLRGARLLAVFDRTAVVIGRQGRISILGIELEKSEAK